MYNLISIFKILHFLNIQPSELHVLSMEIYIFINHHLKGWPFYTMSSWNKYSSPLGYRYILDFYLPDLILGTRGLFLALRRGRRPKTWNQKPHKKSLWHPGYPHLNNSPIPICSTNWHFLAMFWKRGQKWCEMHTNYVC